MTGEPEEFMGPVKMGASHFVDFGRHVEHSPDGKAYLLGMGAEVQEAKPDPCIKANPVDSILVMFFPMAGRRYSRSPVSARAGASSAFPMRSNLSMKGRNPRCFPMCTPHSIRFPAPLFVNASGR